jgi:hypothetical protein
MQRPFLCAKKNKREAEEKMASLAREGTVPIMSKKRYESARTSRTVAIASVAIDEKLDRKPAGTCLFSSGFVSRG